MRRHYNLIVSFVLTVAMLMSLPAFALDDGPDPSEACTHEWGEWVQTLAPTCGDVGSEERECSLCHEVETQVIAATGQHDWNSWKVTRKATVFKKGSKKRVCAECGKVQTSSIKRVKAFAKFRKKSYSLKKGKTLALKAKVKMGRGDSIKKWKVSNSSIATISKKGKLKARKGGKVKVTVILKSGKKSTCTVRIKVPKKKKSSGHGGTVYWTPYGSVYHVSRNCPTLSRSRTIYSGSISESGKSRCCKVCG